MTALLRRPSPVVAGLARGLIGGVASPAAAVPQSVAARGKSIMKPSVHIPHMKWRDGRPRFEPGPAMRRLGYKGRDLKHPTGLWFKYEDTLAESQRLGLEAKGRAQTREEGHRLPRVASPAMGRSLGQLEHVLFQLPEFRGREIRDGKKLRKGLSPKTVESYERSARAIEKACARLAARQEAATRREADNLWDVPAALWTPKLANALLHEIERQSGLHQARACRAFMSQLWSRIGRHEPGAMKSLWAEIEQLPVPEGRIRPWTPEEFRVMCDTADTMGRPEMADSFALGAFTATRQTDRLAWTMLADTGTHIEARQAKTGKLVSILKLPLLARRLEAARERRKLAKVQWPHILIDEREGKPWHASGDHYRKVFGIIRREAAKTLPSCATCRDQDLRDTAQTWLDRAAVTSEAIAAVAGHELSSAAAMQKKHYVADNRRKADGAMMLLGHWLEGKL